MSLWSEMHFKFNADLDFFPTKSFMLCSSVSSTITQTCAFPLISCIWIQPGSSSHSFTAVLHPFLFFYPSGQHRLQHQDGHQEELGPAHHKLFWSSTAAGLQPDEKGLVPQVPPLWHLSASHPEERPGSHHVPQKVTLLCLQRERRGQDRALSLVKATPRETETRWDLHHDFPIVKNKTKHML